MKNHFEIVDETEEMLIEKLGKSELLLSIIKALDYETKENIYAFICRMNDIETECEERK